MNIPAPTSSVDSVFSRYPEEQAACLRALRKVIVEVAEEEGVAPLDVSLKWGQPSFCPAKNAGTAIRIDKDEAFGGHFALYVNCRTTLVSGWRARFEDFTFGGNRSVHFTTVAELGRPEVKMMIAEALTYRRNKRRQPS